ncbi:MAG: 7-cyano-7-deazaguanine synthase [Elusimicrobia bacterium]|nr:7-cyano-7-deazaguanine synthase [Elusimicrobiota bacterium]
MTHLCGAWSLSGQSVRRLIPEARRRAALARASGADEVVAGPLWLACAPGSRADTEAGILAWDGFVSFGPGGPPELEAWLHGSAGERSAGPPGHYVAAYAEPSRGALSLLRDPTGGERLYFSVVGGLLLFAASLKTLLALRGPREGTLDAETSFERGISELIHFGDRTLVEGVREVLPGHRLSVERGRVGQAWASGGLLQPLEGDVPTLARSLRRNLKAAVEGCIGREDRAAVALSGGVDSVSVAALAAEAVGPERVHAFTFEYEDPEHPSEVAAAARACRRLGIRDHRVVRISFDEFSGIVPEAVWSAEDPAYWKRSYPMILAKAARAAGFDRFLTGFGIGSHMGYLEDCSRAMTSRPLPQGTLRHWRDARVGTAMAAPVLDRSRPGLEPPIFRLYYPLLCLLRVRGFLKDLAPFFPPGIGSLVERTVRSPRVVEAVAGTKTWPLSRLLRFQAFIHMNSCADVARCERLARETGAAWLGPAHFPSCLPLCYLPVPTLRGPRARLRPGKLLLHEAMRDVLPEATRLRKKNWAQTIGSRNWRNRVLARMDAAAGPSWDAVRPLFGKAFEAAKLFAPEGMIPLAFWHRVFLTDRRAAPPSWRELEHDG